MTGGAYRSLILLALACLALTCGRPLRLNVLLVSFDTTRADRIGCYGRETGTTPHLDSLAAHGIRFEQAFSPVPITLPAHTSLFTGAYPASHGVRSNGMFRLRRDAPTLAASFKSKGYATAAFLGAFVLNSRFGLDQGFETYDDDMQSGGYRAGLLGNRERRAGEVTDRALGWLAENSGRPFFLFVHYFDPHRPWEAPEPYAGRFRDPYDAEIAYADSQLGRLLAALDSLGLAGRTSVTVLADHGEGLGEHGEDTHATFVYNSTVRVPLVLRVPGRADLCGRVVRENVSLVDVAPTLASLCAVEIPAWSQGVMLVSGRGESLKADRRPLYLECYYPFYSHGWSPLEAVVQGRKKYIRAPRRELYDLARDPAELENLAEPESQAADSLDQVLGGLKEAITVPARLAGSRAAAVQGEEAARLRSLGYVSGYYKPPPEDFSRLPDPKEMIATVNRYMLGVTYMADGRLDLAAREFERLLAGDSTNYSACEFLAETELQRHRFSAARAAALQAARAPQPSTRALFLLGLTSLFTGDTTGAEVLIDRTLENNSSYGPALAIKARLVDAQGRPQEALPVYLKAGAEMPDNPDLLTDLGSCYIELGRFAEAEKVLERAAGLEGAPWSASFNLGVAHQHEGRFEEAAAAYRRAAALPEASPQVCNNLGICLFSEKKYPESEAAYRKAVALDSSYSEAWNNLGGSLAAQGKTREAAGAYSHALQLNPGYPEACLNYGLLLAERLGMPDSGLALIDRGLALSPDSPRRRRIERLATELKKKAALH